MLLSTNSANEKLVSLDTKLGNVELNILNTIELARQDINANSNSNPQKIREDLNTHVANLNTGIGAVNNGVYQVILSVDSANEKLVALDTK